MKKFEVRVSTSETWAYVVEAKTEEEARDLVMSDEVEKTQLVDCAVDDVETFEI